MRETRREYQRLNAYKRDISAEINELVGRDDISDEDVEDFVKAANVMLEQKGIAPLEIGPITKGMIRYSKGHLE